MPLPQGAGIVEDGPRVVVVVVVVVEGEFGRVVVVIVDVDVDAPPSQRQDALHRPVTLHSLSGGSHSSPSESRPSPHHWLQSVPPWPQHSLQSALSARHRDLHESPAARAALTHARLDAPRPVQAALPLFVIVRAWELQVLTELLHVERHEAARLRETAPGALAAGRACGARSAMAPSVATRRRDESRDGFACRDLPDARQDTAQGIVESRRGRLTRSAARVRLAIIVPEVREGRRPRPSHSTPPASFDSS